MMCLIAYLLFRLTEHAQDNVGHAQHVVTFFISGDMAPTAKEDLCSHEKTATSNRDIKRSTTLPSINCIKTGD